MSKALKTTTKALAKSKEGEDVLMSEEKTIYLIDSSGSMGDKLGTYQGKSLTKVEAVRMALGAMMEARLSYPTDDHVGIVTFGYSGSRGMAREVVPLKPCDQKHIELAKSIRASGGTPE